MCQGQSGASYIKGGRTLSRTFTASIGLLALLRMVLAIVQVRMISETC
jgi:hypothetical protein